MVLFIFFCVAAIAGLFYYWFTLKYKYFEKLGIPGPKPKFPWGNMPNQYTRSRNAVYDVDDIYQAFRGKAPFVGYFDMKTPSYLIIDPEMIKTVLVKNFKNFHDNTISKMTDKERDPIFGRNPFMLRGEEWKEKRAEITPGLTPSRIKALFPVVDEILQRFSKYINDQVKKDNKEPFDGREICAKYTIDVVSSCVFNDDAQSFTKEKPEIREMGKKIFQLSSWSIFVFTATSIFPILGKFLKASVVSKEIDGFFTNMMHQAIGHREKNPINREDYLAYLIAMRNKNKIDELDMVASGMSFFIDGFETTSGAITHTLFELADNKIVQEKLRNEIKEIFNKDGKIIYDKMMSNEYLDQVFHEAVRIHPPALTFSKICTEAIELEGVKGKKHQVNVNDNLLISIHSVHNDPNNYTDPEKFIPERFNPEHGGLKAFKDKGVYLGFGDGPRICLGMRFALMQSKAAIAHLVKNFEITVNAKTQRPLVIGPNELLNVNSGVIWLDFKPID